MKRKHTSPDGVKSVIRGAEGLLELIVLSAVYYLVWQFGYKEYAFPEYLGKGKYVLAGVYALLTLFLFFNYDGFKFGYLTFGNALASQWIALFIVNFITYWQLCLIANVMISPLPMLVLLTIDFALSMGFCAVYTFIYHRTYTPKNMVMVFGNNDAVTLKFKMDTRQDKYIITKLLPASEGLEHICQELHNYDAVVINDIEAQLRNDILKYCYAHQIRAYVAPKVSDIIIKGGENINLFETPLILVKGKAMTVPQKIVKRIFDIIVSGLVLLVGSPFMLLVALAIKLEDVGPVFFKQSRVTYNNRRFDILKFRSMIVDAEKEGLSIPATGKDPRITKVGNFIRATRLDELPQCINILKGDMSIVGPRPERWEHMEKYGKLVPEFQLRTKVKGGLTGYAQIYGKYNTTPYDKLRLDMMYIENYSFFNDIKLILMTIRIMLKKDSTEGFDKIEELEKKKEELLHEIYEEEAPFLPTSEE